MQRDSIANTFIVAVSLCLVCALVVSSATVALRPLQEANKELDRKKNVLMAAGLIDKSAGSAEVEKQFELVESLVVDLTTGEILTDADASNIDPLKDSKSDSDELRIVLKDDPARIKRRENRSVIYRVNNEAGEATQYVFPIRGYGLWSTLYGYLAVKPDFNTIAGITYYEQGETPGLGGEVENESWKAQWQGKQLYDADQTVAIELVKGTGAGDSEIDGLSGATITSNGVENMIRFWFGDQGFKSVIESLKSSS